jgi:GAF domain-containing protein
VARTALDCRAVHIPDVLADAEYKYVEAQRAGGFRTVLGIPMMRDGKPIGVLSLSRSAVRPFTEKQIELVETFADQAVIAFENARLFKEVQQRTNDLSESLRQQTATAEVLKTISRSAFDLQRVLDSLLGSACQLCEADFGTIRHREGVEFRLAATFGCEPEWIARFASYSTKPDRSSVFGRTILEGAAVHIPDVLADLDFNRPEAQKLMGFRAALGVPMIREGQPFGVINLFRFAVGPFSEKQIELVQTFADQSVIAIENARLFNEVQHRTDDLSEALQQQTATANVLKAISRSAFDLETVLKALVEAAARLCEADQGTIARQHGAAFVRVATWGFSDQFTELVQHLPVEPERGSATGRALLERQTVHIADIQADPDYTFAEARRLGGFRTILAVPMLRENEPIGVLTLTRFEARPFTDKQIELVTTFADQAAIAIENVRLFEQLQHRTRELSESLEELRSAQDRLVQTEKLASLGQLTAGIAHEIKNPLNFVNNFSALSAELVDEMNEMLEEVDLEDKKRQELDEVRELLKGNLEKIVQHGKRADSIVKNMLLHSRSSSREHRAVEINAIIDESLNLAYHGARAEQRGFDITLERDFDPAVGLAEIYPQEITRVFLNLISNGFHAATKRAAESGNGFEPRLKVATRGLGDRIEVRIRDNGAGIPLEIREKIFNPFFTTKPAGEGTGLGLSMSHDIVVKQHGGTIDLRTEPGAFTEFVITLPRTMSVQAAASEQKN